MLGKVADDEFRRLVGDVEIDAVEAALLHFEVDRARHHVARRQFGAFVVFRHEAAAVRQAQQRALAAHRLGDQERLGVRVIQAGGMKLHEFQVGDPATGAPGHGDAVAGGRIRVGGVEEHLAGAAGGQHGVAGGNRLHRPEAVSST
jgi:hypothetical protein